MLQSRVLTSPPTPPPPCLLPDSHHFSYITLSVRPDTHTHTRKLAAINTEITWSASLSSPEFTPSVSTLSQELQGLYSQHVCTNKRVLSKENSSKGFIFVGTQKVMPN